MTARGLVTAARRGRVALSLGDQGFALLVTAGTAHLCAQFAGAVASTIGAGTAFSPACSGAGPRDGPDTALRYGMTAGAAALLSAGSALSQATDVQRLFHEACARPADPAHNQAMPTASASRPHHLAHSRLRPAPGHRRTYRGRLLCLHHDCRVSCHSEGASKPSPGWVAAQQQYASSPP